MPEDNFYTTKTKAELIQEIDDLKKELGRMQAQIDNFTAAQRKAGSGWLITTPNREYSGSTMGLRFENGAAFVPESMEGAEVYVRRLISDFGYQAEHQVREPA